MEWNAEKTAILLNIEIESGLKWWYCTAVGQDLVYGIVSLP